MWSPTRLSLTAAIGLAALPSTLSFNPGFPYGSQKVRGVNLGGWLVLEVSFLDLPMASASNPSCLSLGSPPAFLTIQVTVVSSTNGRSVSTRTTTRPRTFSRITGTLGSPRTILPPSLTQGMFIPSIPTRLKRGASQLKSRPTPHRLLGVRRRPG